MKSSGYLPHGVTSCGPAHLRDLTENDKISPNARSCLARRGSASCLCPS